VVRYKSVQKLRKDFNNDESIMDDINNYVEQIIIPWHDCLSENSNRSIAIVAGCVLDQLLEKLISAYFIKDKGVRNLFTNDHILQSLFSKIQIAFYSGLIARPFYHDLTNICKIRNKFAHHISANLTFQDASISNIVNNCELRPRDPEIKSAKVKYIIIVATLIYWLCVAERFLSKYQLLYPFEYFDFEKIPFHELAPSKSYIIEFIRKNIPS